MEGFEAVQLVWSGIGVRGQQSGGWAKSRDKGSLAEATRTGNVLF